MVGRSPLRNVFAHVAAIHTRVLPQPVSPKNSVSCPGRRPSPSTWSTLQQCRQAINSAISICHCLTRASTARPKGTVTTDINT